MERKASASNPPLGDGGGSGDAFFGPLGPGEEGTAPLTIPALSELRSMVTLLRSGVSLGAASSSGHGLSDGGGGLDDPSHLLLAHCSGTAGAGSNGGSEVKGSTMQASTASSAHIQLAYEIEFIHVQVSVTHHPDNKCGMVLRIKFGPLKC